MPSPRSVEGALKFTPLPQRSDVLSKKMKLNRFYPYELALCAHDLITVCLAFGLGLWITGSSFSWILIVLSVVIIAFFPTYNLYNYHLIFSPKNHLVNLFKSFGWSLFTFGIIAFVYTWPNVFEGDSLIPAISLVAIALMLLSRFLGNYLLNFIKSMGMSFFAIGMIGLISADEQPIIMAHWLAIVDSQIK